MAIVYQHIRKDTGLPFYIGIGKTKKRAYSKYGRNLYWNRITNYIEYEVEILFNKLSWEDACLKEKELIQKYGRKDLGTGILCNLTDGGDGNVNWTPKLRKEQSERMKGNIPHNKGIPTPLEDRKKISESRIKKGVAKGKKNPMYGKKGKLCPHYGKKRPEHSAKLKGRKKPEGFGEIVSKNMRGSNHHSNKLTENDVLYIRSVYKARDKKYGGIPLSKKYNVSISLIIRVVKNEVWKHI